MQIDNWIKTWRAPLTALIAGWGAPWSDAAELAEDTLVEGYLARDSFRGDPEDPQTVGPWLRGVARNLFIARLRQSRRRRTEPLDPDSVAQPSVADDGEDPRLDDVRVAMRNMPERLREVLYLRYLEESSLTDISALLGLSIRAVEGRLHRARTHLRRRLDAQAPLAGGTKS